VVVSAMETELGVLKNEIEGMHKAFDLFRAEFSSKLDIIMAMQVQVVQLQERYNNAQASIDRAFNAIGELERRGDDTKGYVDKSLGGAKIFAITGALIVGMLQWYFLKQIDSIEATNEMMTTIDRRVAWLEHEKYGRAEPLPEKPQ
jgi:hypothetical protein